jgi:hypothetical protein
MKLSRAVIPGRHLIGLESPTYFKGKFQESYQYGINPLGIT